MRPTSRTWNDGILVSRLLAGTPLSQGLPHLTCLAPSWASLIDYPLSQLTHSQLKAFACTSLCACMLFRFCNRAMQPPNTSCLDTYRLPMEAIYSCLLDFGGMSLFVRERVCVCVRARACGRGPVLSTDEHVGVDYLNTCFRVPGRYRSSPAPLHAQLPRVVPIHDKYIG